MLSTETGLRGFVITRRSSFLKPYRDGVPRVRRYADRVADRIGKDRAAITAIRRRFETWHSAFAEPVLAWLAAGRELTAQRAQQAGLGKVHIDAIRRQIAWLSERRRAELKSDQRRGRRFAIVGAILAGGLGILGLVVGLRLGRRVRRDVIAPVQALAGAAERFGAGDHDVRAPVLGVHEIRVTADAFNRMAGELDLTVDELRQLDELKSRFVSTVSHELRTPLTAIKGFVDELADDMDELNEDQREAVQIIARNSGHLEAIIDDLLLVSKLESGRLVLTPSDVVIDELMLELVRELTPAAQARGVAIRLDAPADVVLTADRGRLRQACANLVANAIKFSPAGADVDVAVRAVDDLLIVEVGDQGPGIPADELPRLGERFFRASTAGGVPGTGLGLTITRELVERHGGRLQIESVLGAGATFRIVLPRAGLPQALGAT